MKKKILLSLLVIISACKQKTQNNNEKNKIYQLKQLKQIQIKIEPEINYFSYFTYVIEKNDTTYLIRDNYKANNILIYNWNKKKLIKKIGFKIEGPQGIGFFEGSAIMPLNLETFVISTINGKTYYTINNKIIYSLKNIKGKEILRSYGLNPYKPQIYKNKIYYHKNSDIEIKNPNYFKQTLLFNYNFKNKKFDNIDVSFLQAYAKNEWSTFQTKSFFTKKNNNLIIGFGNNNFVYKYDMKNDKIIDTIQIPNSKFQTTIKPIKNDKNEALRLKRSSFNYSITFDRYKKVYYRIFFVPVNQDDKITNKFDFTETMPFVIQVLDTDFNILTEKKLPSNSFNLKDYFVTKEGLWISNNNPANKDFDENTQSFTLFKLIKKL